MQDQRLEINHTFADRTGQQRVLVPVLTPEGNIKILKIGPSKQPLSWLSMEWTHREGRPHRLVSVSLKTERRKAGAAFLQHVYEAEGFNAGWKAFQEYLEASTTREIEDDDGNKRRAQLVRHRPLKVPDSILPARAFELREKAKHKKTADREWNPSTPVKRPQPKAK